MKLNDIWLSNYAKSNTLNYSYWYWNVDINTYDVNADDFTPKLTSLNTEFNYFFSWDNNDDDWDSFCITNCVSFNNYINYQLSYYFVEWSNNWSFNVKKKIEWINHLKNQEILLLLKLFWLC